MIVDVVTPRISTMTKVPRKTEKNVQRIICYDRASILSILFHLFCVLRKFPKITENIYSFLSVDIQTSQKL